MKAETVKVLNVVRLTAADIDMLVRREAKAKVIRIHDAERAIAKRFGPWGMSIEKVRDARKAARETTS